MAVQAPTAVAWQNLYNLYWTLAVAAGVITIGALVFFAWRYRARRVAEPYQPIAKENPHTGAVVIVAVLMAIVLIAAAFQSFQVINLYETPPQGNAIHVNVVGQRFFWNFSCSNPCSSSGPGTLVVPHNTTIIMNITSVDVFHSFSIPALRVKADAIPGKSNALWFSAPVGRYRIQCFELCGNGHYTMIGTLIVV